MADHSTGYQVYLNIVRADLPQSHRSDSAAVTYAKIFVDGHKKNLQTKHSVETSDPIYNQEFVLNVPSSTSTIMVKLKSHHRVKSNKTVGTVKFNLSDLEDGVADERTMPMEEGGTITMIVSRRANPSLSSPKVHAEIAERLPNLRIVLEKTEYYPGDVIRGFVRYFERSKVAISGVRLGFEGRSLVHWTEHSGNTTVHYRSSAPLLEHTSMLYGTKDYKHKEKIGPHFFLEKAFEFQLPKQLAPSIGTGNGGYVRASNDYRVVAFVQRDGNANKKAIAKFKILSPPSAASLEVATATIGKLVNDGDVNISVSAPRTFYRGKPYEVNVVIDNTKGTKTIDTMKFKIKYSRYAYAKSGRMSKRKESSKVYSMKMAGGKTKASTESSQYKHKEFHNETDILPVKPGERREGKVTLLINEPLLPTLHSSISPLIHSEYQLKAKVKTSGGKKAKTKFPIMGMEERNWAENHNDVLSPQCRVFTPPSQVASTPYLAPINCTDGKRLNHQASMRSGVFNFDAFGSPVVPDSYSGHDSKFMHSSHYRIKDTRWSVGRSPHWVKHTELSPHGVAPNHGVPHEMPTGQHHTTIVAPAGPAIVHGAPAGPAVVNGTPMTGAYGNPNQMGYAGNQMTYGSGGVNDPHHAADPRLAPAGVAPGTQVIPGTTTILPGGTTITPAAGMTPAHQTGAAHMDHLDNVH